MRLIFLCALCTAQLYSQNFSSVLSLVEQGYIKAAAELVSESSGLSLYDYGMDVAKAKPLDAQKFFEQLYQKTQKPGYLNGKAWVASLIQDHEAAENFSLQVLDAEAQPLQYGRAHFL